MSVATRGAGWRGTRSSAPVLPSLIALMAVFVALALGASSVALPLAPLLLVVGPAGAYLIATSPAARLIAVVGGGFLVFGSSSGVGATKIAYLGILLLSAAVSTLNLIRNPPAWAEAFSPLLLVAPAMIACLLLSAVSAPDANLVSSIRQGLFYLMIPLAPIIGIDAGGSIPPRLLRAGLWVLGVFGSISYCLDWLSRRGVSASSSGRFLASSFLVPAMVWLLALVLVATGRGLGRLAWTVPVVVIPIALLLPGTRTNLVMFVGVAFVLGARRRFRIPPMSLLAIVGIVIAALVVLVPILASVFISDRTFLSKRIAMFMGVLNGGGAADQSAEFRRAQYLYAWQHIQQSPWFGNGPGFAADLTLDTPLTVIMRIGFVGTAVLILLLVCVLVGLLRSGRRLGGDPFVTAGGAVFVVVACLVPFGTIVEDRGFAMMIMLLLAGLGCRGRHLLPTPAAVAITTHTPCLFSNVVPPVRSSQIG